MDAEVRRVLERHFGATVDVVPTMASPSDSPTATAFTVTIHAPEQPLPLPAELLERILARTDAATVRAVAGASRALRALVRSLPLPPDDVMPRHHGGPGVPLTMRLLRAAERVRDGRSMRWAAVRRRDCGVPVGCRNGLLLTYENGVPTMAWQGNWVSVRSVRTGRELWRRQEAPGSRLVHRFLSKRALDPPGVTMLTYSFRAHFDRLPVGPGEQLSRREFAVHVWTVNAAQETVVLAHTVDVQQHCGDRSVFHGEWICDWQTRRLVSHRYPFQFSVDTGERIDPQERQQDDDRGFVVEPEIKLDTGGGNGEKRRVFRVPFAVDAHMAWIVDGAMLSVQLPDGRRRVCIRDMAALVGRGDDGNGRRWGKLRWQELNFSGGGQGALDNHGNDDDDDDDDDGNDDGGREDARIVPGVCLLGGELLVVRLAEPFDGAVLLVDLT